MPIGRPLTHNCACKLAKSRRLCYAVSVDRSAVGRERGFGRFGTRTTRRMVNFVGDPRLWLLIGVAILLIFTVEAVEGYVEGVWPQLRHDAPAFRSQAIGRSLWVSVAFLLLPGIVLALLNLGLLVWKGLPQNSTQIFGAFFLGIGWLLFALTSIDLIGLGRYMRRVGPAAPLALIVCLLVGDLLLLAAILDLLPAVRG